jgi:hypothetical protein
MKEIIQFRTGTLPFDGLKKGIFLYLSHFDLLFLSISLGQNEHPPVDGSSGCAGSWSSRGNVGLPKHVWHDKVQSQFLQK